MMATVAVTSLLPAYNAKADESHNNGAICTPKSVSLGTDTGVGTEDTGIATYVGGDMYVGQKVSGTMNNTAGPNGSYAAEAEGLTAVNGKLLLHPLKGVWATYYTDTDGALNGRVKDYRGFRFGIVGFGGQYRPKDGSSALEVKGASSDNDISWVGGAQAWGNAGWIGKNSDQEPSYKAHISGAETTVYGGSSNPVPSNGSSNPKRYDYTRQSVYDPFSGGSVSWNQKVDKIGSTNETFDSFKSYISKLSTDLFSLKNSGSVYAANAQDATNSGTYSSQFNNLKRSKYNGKYTFKIQYVNEKVILFKGDGKSSMQVFNLPASMLNNSSSYSGVSFAFENIPDSSSVVINVTGDGAQNITFHNGWRFWWTDMNNNKSELGGSYTDPDYAKRAQQIMWNFPQTQNLTIQGGQGAGPITIKQISAAESAQGVWGESTRDTDTNAVTTTDDPAAGLLGSVLVPNGSFESHVSTNGRVWVGNDFSMYNPTAVGVSNALFVNVERSHSASALDMDQERHNLPWNGSYFTQCAAVAWDKVDASTKAALGGTTWAVYASKSDAQDQTNALKTVTDNAYGDDDSNNGSFSIGGLNPNAIYYIREVSANNTAYATNTNIYAITAGGEGSTARVVTNVYDSKGREITDSDKKLLPGAGDNSANAKIANKRSGTSIEWSKVDGTDTETLLGGSAWKLSKMNGDTASEEWAITDDQSGTEVKSVKIFDAKSSEVASASFTNSTAQQFHAVAYDQNGTPIDNAKLTWSSADSAVAAVSENGLVTPTGDGNTTITVKSADGKVTASFTVNVSGVTVETSVSINGYTDGQEIGYTDGQEISLEKGKTLKLTASVAPQGNIVEWSTSNNADNVSLSATIGTSVTLTANKVTSSPVMITAKEIQGNKTFTLSVTVTAKQYLTLYFQAQNNWPANNVKVHYQTTNDSDWTDISMTQMDGSCNSYAYANIPLTGSEAIDSTSQFGFKYINGNGWYGAGRGNVPKDGDNFKFTNGNELPEVVVISAGPSYSTTAPSGCAVTSTAAYSSRRAIARSGEHRAVASVLRTQSNVVNVAENSTVSSKKDENTAAGKFKVSDLANGTYHLQEKTAPNGYEVSNTVYTITITGGNATWNPSITDSKIANTRKTGAVTWTKVSSDSNNVDPLPGSQWTLKQTKTFSWENGMAKYTDVTSDTALATVTDCVDGQSSVADCSAQTGEYVDLDGAAGRFKISGLAWGEYELIESKAPDGYDLDATPHKFRIGPLEDGNIAGDWYANSNFKTDGKSSYSDASLTVNGGNVENKPGVILPGTGGAGDYWIYAAALVAALIGVVAAGMALKVRRQQ